jgi:hypothetical protein
MAFPGELIKKVGWKVAHPNSADTLHPQRTELRLGRRQGYLITCVQGQLSAELKALELGPTKKGVESVVWNPAILQVTDERFRRRSDDENGKEAHESAQQRMDRLNYYAPGKYRLIIKDYPTEAVMIKIIKVIHEPTPEGTTDPQTDETTIYVATASPVDDTFQ